MCISTTTLTSSPSGSTAAGQKQEACSSTGSLSKPSPSDRPRTTPSSATLILPGRPPHWSEGDTLLPLNEFLSRSLTSEEGFDREDRQTRSAHYPDQHAGVDLPRKSGEFSLDEW